MTSLQIYIQKDLNMSSWVTLNVGGQKFVTNSSVFMKEPECMLAKMFSGEMRPGEKDEGGAYLIDRSPDYFKPILNYFRTGKVFIDSGLSVDGVLEEAEYYGIGRLILLLQDLKEKERNNQAKDSDDVEFEKLRKFMELSHMCRQIVEDWRVNKPKISDCGDAYYEIEENFDKIERNFCVQMRKLLGVKKNVFSML